MITARQVAQAAGVSVSTVGRALADDPRISVDTRARVRQIADELGYVENTPARMMRGGTSRLIGLLLPDICNEFYSTIADALSKCCEAEGYLLVLGIADDPLSESRYIKELVSNRAAGLIIVPTAAPRREVKGLLQNLPHVQLLRQANGWDAPWFGMDDADSLANAVRHLTGLGHKQIAYIGGPESLSTGAARVSGVRRALAEAGIASHQNFERLGPPTHAFGRESTMQLIDSTLKPTAIVSGSVQVTKAMLDVLVERNISVPRDLSVVGFGNMTGLDWWEPGLATIHLPVRELARTCGLWLLDHIKANRAVPCDHRVVFPSRFTPKGSTATP